MIDRDHKAERETFEDYHYWPSTIIQSLTDLLSVSFDFVKHFLLFEKEIGVNYDLDWYFGSDLVLNFSNPTFNFDFRFLNALVDI